LELTGIGIGAPLLYESVFENIKFFHKLYKRVYENIIYDEKGFILRCILINSVRIYCSTLFV
jgi:hypothetical protein